MNNHHQPKGRTICFNRLTLPDDRAEGPLTDDEVSWLLNRAVVRSAHYLELAEQYLADLSKLNKVDGLDERLEGVSAACAFIEKVLNRMPF